MSIILFFMINSISPFLVTSISCDDFYKDTNYYELRFEGKITNIDSNSDIYTYQIEENNGNKIVIKLFKNSITTEIFMRMKKNDFLKKTQYSYELRTAHFKGDDIFVKIYPKLCN